VLGPHLSPEQHARFVNAQGVGPIIKSVSITYRSPTEYPDTIALGVRVDPERVGRDRFTQSFLALSHATGRVVAEGEAVVVCFDYAQQRKADIPEYVVTAFRRAMAGAGGGA
jgi:acyl-CoA thioester hydrolase